MEEKKYCSVCGAQNEADAKFCASCGMKLVQKEETPAPEAVVPENVVPETPVMAEPVVQPATVTETSTPVTTTHTEPQQQYYSVENMSEDNGYQGVAIAALVCGIVSLVCCPSACCGCFGAFNILVAIAAVVLGIIALVKKFAGKGMAIAGLVCGGIALLGMCTTLLLGSLGTSSLTSDVLGEDFQDAMEELYDELGMDYNF